MSYRYLMLIGICCAVTGRAALARATPAGPSEATLVGDDARVTGPAKELSWPGEPGEQGEQGQEAGPGGAGEPTGAPDPCAQRPWTCAVSEEEQQQALALFQEGNQLFDDSLFVAAVDKYRSALAHWEHPSIHYNLMLALVALDRPIEAYESSVATLRHGPEALRPDEYLRATDYQKLLRGRIAELEVRCSEPGATVSLDGELLFRAPGSVRRFVLPGKHELVTRKRGYLTTHQTLQLAPDKLQIVEVAMLPADQALITIRSWKRWQPWVAVGTGVGLGLVGAVLEWRADANNRALQTLFGADCPAPEGCQESSYSHAVQRRMWRSTWYRRVGRGAAVAGAAAALTGLVFVYLNRPQQMENPLRRHLVRVSVAPAVRPESAGLSLQVDF